MFWGLHQKCVENCFETTLHNALKFSSGEIQECLYLLFREIWVVLPIMYLFEAGGT